MVNALTVDVEEYFQVHNLESRVQRSDWDRYESRVEASTGAVLDLMAEGGVKGTFFVLGWIAERQPNVVRRIAAAGHEIATHGYDHRLVYRLTPAEFRHDLTRAVAALQDITGQRVLGYRAPSFSITRDSLWALDVIGEVGLQYDASICPARSFNGRYGIPGMREGPHRVRPQLWEFPVAVATLGPFKSPVGGGGWLRHYPYSVTALALRRLNRSGRPFIVYVHPWEIDCEQPRIKTDPWRAFLHYHNLSKTASRLASLMREFQFGPVRHVLGLEAAAACA